MSGGLVVAAGVEGEFAQEYAGVAVDHPDVEVVDEQRDRGAGEQPAQADVVQSAVVAQAHGAGAVDVNRPGVSGGSGLWLYPVWMSRFREA
jgi:hypothetical protein